MNDNQRATSRGAVAKQMRRHRIGMLGLTLTTQPRKREQTGSWGRRSLKQWGNNWTEDQQELETREKKRKVEDVQRIRRMVHEKDKSKRLSHMQNEMERLMHHDEQELLSVLEGWHWDDKGGQSCAPKRDKKKWSTFFDTRCTQASPRKCAYARPEGHPSRQDGRRLSRGSQESTQCAREMGCEGVQDTRETRAVCINATAGGAESCAEEILKGFELEQANRSATPCGVEERDEGEGKSRCKQEQTQAEHEWDNANDGDRDGPRMVDDNDPDSQALTNGDITRYRALVARIRYLSLDRPDLKFSSEQVCCAMAKLTTRDMERVKRIGRYLVGKPKAKLLVPMAAEW